MTILKFLIVGSLPRQDESNDEHMLIAPFDIQHTLSTNVPIGELLFPSFFLHLWYLKTWINLSTRPTGIWSCFYKQHSSGQLPAVRASNQTTVTIFVKDKDV
jgi:hypothetical protein